MSNDNPEQAQPTPSEPQAPRAEPSAPPKVEVRAEPMRGAAEQGRVYDAPPPHREPPPNPFGAPPTPPPPASSSSSSSRSPARAWAVACYLIGMSDLGVSILFAGLIFTAALWLARRGDDPEVDFHGKESLNLQLNILFWQVAAVPLILCCLVGLPILLLSPFVKFGALLYGAYCASQGERQRYPWIFRLIR